MNYTDYDNWNDIELLTGLLIGESRGEPKVGKVGVGLVVRTRVDHPRWWGKTWREVILKKYQFSCWLDLNAEVIKKAYADKSDLWESCLEIAETVYDRSSIDFIGNPTHYHSVRIFPDWASSMKRLMTIGNHVFYRDLKEIP